MRTLLSPAEDPTTTYFPAFNSNASTVRAIASKNQSQRTPSRA
jgi:hypothetical protein